MCYAVVAPYHNKPGAGISSNRGDGRTVVKSFPSRFSTRGNRAPRPRDDTPQYPDTTYPINQAQFPDLRRSYFDLTSTTNISYVPYKYHVELARASRRYGVERFWNEPASDVISDGVEGLCGPCLPCASTNDVTRCACAVLCASKDLGRFPRGNGAKNAQNKHTPTVPQTSGCIGARCGVVLCCAVRPSAVQCGAMSPYMFSRRTIAKVTSEKINKTTCHVSHLPYFSPKTAGHEMSLSTINK